MDIPPEKQESNKGAREKNGASKKSKTEKPEKPEKPEKTKPLLETTYSTDKVFEIGVDEAGRGPLFGRVYAAAVILPKEDFDHSKMKDSKKFHSKKKIEEVAQYIKEHALAWHVSYEDETTIDQINILQATQKCMHTCIKTIVESSNPSLSLKKENTRLLIDGNYFNSYIVYNPERKMMESFDHVCVEGGDNKFSCIAAASILAKVARDQYIEDLCKENPTLVEHYSIDSNKGYGAKKHLEGIAEHGITKWHRRSFAPCKNYV
jgi:ribonuclease HII